MAAFVQPALLTMFDIDAIRQDFPALTQHGDTERVYFDSAATAHKPRCVIDTLTRFYSQENANVHRGAHQLSQRATSRYEHARQQVAEFIGCQHNELVWTKGATEAINLVAYGLTAQLQPKDVILITELEHHANIVPWQQLAKRTGATLMAVPVTPAGLLDIAQAEQMIAQYRPKVFALAHVSNALGNINPVKALLSQAKQQGAWTLVDGAQSLLHLRPQMADLGCDFFVFSAHKCLGPTGLGGLFGRFSCLQQLDVFQTGGEMVAKVRIEHTEFNPPPSKFETGTPNISAVLGFAAAIEYLNNLDSAALAAYEHSLMQYLVAHLSDIESVSLLGDMQHNVGTVSFYVQSEHPYDIATLLDMEGIALRHGHHCAQPLMHALGVNGTVRVSLAFYNTFAEIDHFISALRNTLEMMAP
ncbi:aminotransferase class V-fold PLP-dependent enzyme [Pseudoalteromonas ruthenica]|uniref:aminotransferase class V-fold PLP-dependent enzyme n=1 Tax=Pseudoalteromonas ruthenica TaxID=151081 RepID=UPI002015F2AC|nr:cysteine desulfurase [Pseudoalteromonas ruthenica]